jgi:large subunit ribosomal protein L29
MMKASEIRALSETDIQQKIEEARKELFDLRFKKALHQLDNPAQLRALKHRVAQLKTVLAEKQQQGANA